MKISKTSLVAGSLLLLAATTARAQNRIAWAVTDQDQIQQFTGTWNKVGGQLSYISVAQDTTTWGVNRAGEIYRWNGAGWDRMPGVLVQVSAGSATEVWGVNAGNDVYRWNTGTNNWDKMPGARRQVSVAPDGAVWSIDTNNNIYLWTGYGWQQFSCQAVQISAGSATNVWGINPGGDVIRYSTTTGSQRWDVVPGGPLKQVSVASDGEVWAVNGTNDLLRLNANGGWDQQGQKVAQVSVGPLINAPSLTYAGKVWLTAPLTVNEGTAPRDTCPAGWRLETKSDLNAVLAFAKTQPDPKASLTSGFGAVAGQAVASGDKVYPNADGSQVNGWKYWALFLNELAVAPLNVAFRSADPADNTLAPSNGVIARCILGAGGGAVQSDTGGCSPQFSAAPDLRAVDLTTVQIKDLGRAATGGTGTNTPAAPITLKPQGGAYINYLSTDNKSKVVEVDATGTPVGTDQDLGPATGAGAVGYDGTRLSYLVRNGAKLEFRVAGGTNTVIMDNDMPASGRNVLFSGRGVKWTGTDGNVLFGTEAMFDPMTFHRAVILPAGGKWFASYDHANNFNAISNPGNPDSHYGVTITSLAADGSGPQMNIAWGVSHSIDMRLIADGNRVIQAAIGDAFPLGIRISAVDAQSGAVTTSNIFASGAFPDTQIGTGTDGKPVFGIAGNGGGTTAGKLGDFVQLGCGQYALTYTIEPATFTFNGNTYTSTPNELGLIVVDQNFRIVKRTLIRRGDDVDFSKAARLGKSALLVAWKLKNADEYWAALVDARGVMIQSAQKLPAGVKFTGNDGFATAANGDVIWTFIDGGALKLFRLPQPAQ